MMFLRGVASFILSLLCRQQHHPFGVPSDEEDADYDSDGRDGEDQGYHRHSIGGGRRKQNGGAGYYYSDEEEWSNSAPAPSKGQVLTRFNNVSKMDSTKPSPVVQSVAFALPKTDCWKDLDSDRIPLRAGKEIKMKGLGT